MIHLVTSYTLPFIAVQHELRELCVATSAIVIPELWLLAPAELLVCVPPLAAVGWLCVPLPEVVSVGGVVTVWVAGAVLLGSVR